MQFGVLDRPLAGVAVPLFSLRSGSSVGIGQFPDIAGLARWCSSVGLEVIQLLPLNDTGAASSPYSALSAFALNPVYIDILSLEGSAPLRQEVAAFRRAQESVPRVSYERVRSFKMDALWRIFTATGLHRGGNPELEAWMRENPWIVPYAVFMTHKEQARGAPWWEWSSDRSWSPGEGERVFRSLGERPLFHLWVQRAAERQLEAATRAAGRLGVRVKGDLPILMSRDSAEVWAQARFFDAGYQAGAPPDMFSPHGQNWGFPPYRWDALADDDYRLWRGRIRKAGMFYHAVRIDHVLGFLRIWRIPETESSGILGHFHPQRPIRREELRASFDDGRLSWLSIPHTRGADIEAALGADAPRVKERWFRRLPNEDLYHLRPEVDGERALEGLEEPEPVRAYLLSRHRDRALIRLDQGTFAPAWYFAASSAFRSLTSEERSRLEGMVRSSYADSERIWEQNGRNLLGMLRESTDMLLCAEDLGAVPDCLPRLLEDLGILSLKIERWARDYKSPGHPYIPPDTYPRLSVCAPSVHDTAPLRGWWEEPGWDRAAYYAMIGGSGACPATLTTSLCATILSRAMRSRSLIAVAQIQDYLALTDDLRVPEPSDERVNVPGTVGVTNWSYRLPDTIEGLEGHEELCRRVRELVAERALGAAAAHRPGVGS